jgi:hypothetical protein
LNTITALFFEVLGFDEVNANQIFHLLDDDESGEAKIWISQWTKSQHFILNKYGSFGRGLMNSSR